MRAARTWIRRPAVQAAGSGHVDIGANTRPGFGVTVVVLKYVSAQTIVRLVAGFALRPGRVRIEVGRNLVLIQGNSAERASAIKTVLSFDVDWMSKQSVGIFPVHKAAPEPLIPELQSIFGAKNQSIGAALIQFQAMPRVKSILVVSKNVKLIKRARTWIRRLDRNKLRASVHVYRAKYRDAGELAKIVGGVFGSAAASTGEKSEDNVDPTAPAAHSGVSAAGAGGAAAWTASLRRCLDCDPPHVSTYGLTYEEGTP